MSKIRRSFYKVFKKTAHGVQSHLKVSKIEGGSESYVQNCFEFCPNLCGLSCRENDNMFTNDWAVLSTHFYLVLSTALIINNYWMRLSMIS